MKKQVLIPSCFRSLYASQDHLRLFLRVLLVSHPISLVNASDKVETDLSRSVTSGYEAVNYRILTKASFYEMAQLRDVVVHVALEGVASLWNQILDLIPSHFTQSIANLSLAKTLLAGSIAAQNEETVAGINIPALFSSDKKSHVDRVPLLKESIVQTVIEHLDRMKGILDLMMAFPRQYITAYDKFKSSLFVLLSSWLLHQLYPLFGALKVKQISRIILYQLCLSALIPVVYICA